MTTDAVAFSLVYWAFFIDLHNLHRLKPLFVVGMVSMISVLQINGKEKGSTSGRENSVLNRSDVSVSNVNSVEEAHKNLSNGHRFDCIVCHDNSSGFDGLGLLRTLRKTGNTTPFYMVTDTQNPDVTRNALQLGAEEVIAADSYSPEVLQLRLEKLGEKKINTQVSDVTNLDLSKNLEILRERAELLENKEKEYDTLLRLMAREFRDQINTINEFARILDEDFDELSAEDARKHLRLITKSSSRVKRTLDTLQDYQKAQLSKIQPQDVNVSVIVSSIVDDLTSSTPGRMVRACVASDLLFNGDEALMHLCMDHLLNVIWKSTLRKSYTEVTFGSYRDSQQRIFFISNNGDPITDVDQARVKNPFISADLDNFFTDKNDLAKSGTLSLAIVDRIIERHGGQLWTETSEAKSTTFLFSFSEA
jgi:signal transduction histidine kinase